MLHTQGKPTDLTSMSAWLADNGSLEKIGGNSKLVELVENVSSTASIEKLAILINDNFMRRQLIRFGNEVGQLGIDQTKDTNEVLDEAEQKKNLEDSNDIDDLENFLKSQVFRFMKEYKITNAFFEKDNKTSSERKISYVFREFDKNKQENFSIFFKVISTRGNGINKLKNEDFFEELNKDRIDKSCEYAVLVSLLEHNSEIYNSGIVDVSNKFSEMYVVRPESLLTIISLLKNIFLEAGTVEKRNTLISSEEEDIKSFEKYLNKFREYNSQAFPGWNNNIKTLSELISEPKDEELMEGMDKTLQKEDLGNWLSQLNEMEQKIMKLRYGLEGEEPLTLSEICRQIKISREKVEQIEAKAILKLRVEAQYLNSLLKKLAS